MERKASWLGGTILLAAGAAGLLHLGAGAGLVHALVTALAAIAVACPCTLGIAVASAYAAGGERAATSGWVVSGGAAFDDDAVAMRAIRLGAAGPEALLEVARAVRRAVRRNMLWAVGLNLLSLPWAVWGPLDPAVPAATMLSAWALISITNRRLRHSSVGSAAGQM